MTTPEERLRWLRETHDVGIPLDLAIAAAPLLPNLTAAARRAVSENDDDGCYNAGAVDTPGLHRPNCNAIRNGGPCDAGGVSE